MTGPPKGPELPGHRPPAPPARHPLLGLTPEARRQLARTLLKALEVQREADLSTRRDAGVRGAGIVAATGLGLGLVWAGAGLGAAPFAAVYAAIVALQAAAGPAMARGAYSAADPAWVRAARAFALAPADAAAAIRSAAAAEQVSPDRLVLAAGLLVAVRHPLSSSLLRRLMGRAYPVAEVEGAIALLVRGGWVAPAPAAPGVLLLTPAGISLLRGLGVPAPTNRVRRDPDIAPHLLPLFAALDARAPRSRREPGFEAGAALQPAEVHAAPVRGPEAAPAREPDGDPEPVLDHDAEPEFDPGVDPELELDAEPELDPGADPELDLDAEPEFDPGVDPELELDAEPELDPDDVPERAPADAAEGAVVDDPAHQPQSNPASRPHPTPEPEAFPEPAPKIPPAPAAQPLGKIVQFPKVAAPPPPAPPVDLPRLNTPAAPVARPVAPPPAPPREEPPAALDELVIPALPGEDEDEEDVTARPRRRLPWPLLATAGIVALVGALVWIFPPAGPLGPTERVRLSAAPMPHSRGTAIQFNGRGSLLSSFGGDLFLSIPERLDYKQAMSFRGFDMAADCGLVDPDIRTARVSPLGRFIWVASGPSGRERCMVDLETKTVTHDLPARDAAYGLPHLVGWAGPQTLLMAQQPPPTRIARWWSIDVASHRATPLQVPAHQRVLPLTTEGGPALMAGFDDQGEGKWKLTTYWLDGRGFHEIRAVKVTLPDSRRGATPQHAAVSPDKRYLLVALRGALGARPAATGSLVVVALEDGTVTPLDLAADPLVDQPIFWAPGVLDGHYRFYFNGEGPDGIVPLAGDLRVEPGS